MGIQNRVLVISLLPATAIAVALGAYFIGSQIQNLRESLEDRGLSVVRHLAQASEFGVFSGSTDSLRRLAQSMKSEVDVTSIVISDTSGVIRVEEGRTMNAYHMQHKGLEHPQVITSADGHSLIFRALISQSTLPVDDYDYYDVTSGTLPATSRGKAVLGWVAVEMSLDRTADLQRTQILKGIGITGILLFLTALLAMRIGRAVSDPILHMTEGVQELEKGNLDSRLHTGASDEIAILEAGINNMAASLSAAQENLQEQVELATDELRRTLNELERKNAELEVEQEKAQEASKSKSQFLANMSHELRTPLNAVIGYSEMLQEEIEESGDASYAADIGKINAAGKHLLALINDILDLSKIEAGKMNLYLENAEIRSISQYTISTIQPLAERNRNELVLNCPDSIGEMYSDVTKVRQILFNLLSNACKFTHDGKVTLSVNREQKNGREWVNFRVFDTGIGMSREQMAKLFQPFSQADDSISRNYGGTGLGLAICRRFTDMMGGTLTVDSVPEQGSQFALCLPAVSEIQSPKKPVEELLQEDFHRQARQARQGQVKKPSLSGDRRRSPSTVLIIDDDPSMHDILNRLLSSEGYLVEIAASGDEGLRRAQELDPGVIVLDVLMPGLDGWAVIERLKNNPDTVHIPVVMLTMVDDRSKGYALGVTDYLYKPVDRDQLLSALTRSVRLGDSAPVLVVDDDASHRDLVKRMLERDGWEVIRAQNGNTALQAVYNQTPSVILLDLMMPEMDGFEFIGELRKDSRYRDIPVVVITAMDLTPEDEAKLSGKVSEVLHKGSASREELARLVRDLVHNAGIRRSA